MLLPGYYDFGSTFTVGVPRGYFYCSDDGSERSQCAVALCTVQILLNAAPEKNRSLLIGLFTMMTTLTNSVLPLLGVRLYTALGADLTALYRFNLIDLGVRILSTLGLIWRYQKAKKDGFLTKISD